MLKGFRFILGTAAAVGILFTLPVWWCGRGAAAWFDGDVVAVEGLAKGVEALALADGVGQADFHTGSDLFDGEWVFGTYLMAGFGYGQVCLAHPELASTYEPVMRRCITRLLAADVRAFDALSWGSDPLDDVEKGVPKAHAAYLGYLNLLLGLHREVAGYDAFKGWNDRITAHLVERLERSEIGLLRTYPGEVYPVDNCFVIGGIAQHGKVSGVDRAGVVDAWVKRVRSEYLDADTGLLIQAVSVHDGSALDAPRGSGTTLGLFAVRYADEAFARDLVTGVDRTLARRWLGFGATREYPEGEAGQGDIDSGPIVFGYGMSSTGFALAGARMTGDRERFRRLYATAHLCGAPVRRGDRVQFVSGGGLGNAILFAMVTAPPLEEGP